MEELEELVEPVAKRRKRPPTEPGERDQGGDTRPVELQVRISAAQSNMGREGRLTTLCETCQL